MASINSNGCGGARSARDAWFSYALDLERVHLDEQLTRVSDIPAGDSRHYAPTVYFHVLHGKLMYIGQSNNVVYRRKKHWESRYWDDEYVLIAPDDMAGDAGLALQWMNSVEFSLIEYLNPPHNQRAWGRGGGSPEVWRHIQSHGFKLPNGIVVGEPYVQLIYGPTRMPAG